MHKRTKWMVCMSRSGAFLHVSPKLASIDMRIIDIIDTEENLSPEGLFDAVIGLLPAAEFPPINRSAELGPGNA